MKQSFKKMPLIIGGLICLSGCKSALEVHSYDIENKEGEAYYNNELFTGRTLVKTESGEKPSLNYVNGKLEGKQIQWHYSGEKEMEYFIKDGKKEGEFKIWNEQGILVEETTFKNDFTWGTKKTWRDDGSPISWASFQNTAEEKLNFHGPFKDWNKEGVLIKDYHMENGQMEGSYTTYFDNGALKVSSFYKNGRLDGEYLEFYENGTKKQESTFDQGNKIGIQKVYYEDGSLKQLRKYDIDSAYYYHNNGELNVAAVIDSNGQQGEWKYYHDNGQEIVTLEYKDGKANGIATFYNKDGTINRKIKMIDNKEHPID